MATLSSNTFDTRAGSGTIDIFETGLSADTFEVSSVSEASIEFDIESEDTEAEDIIFTPSRFRFKAFDKMDSGASLFEEIDSNMTSTDEMTITFDFTTDGGLSWTDATIKCTKNDISFEREKREVSFDCVYEIISTPITVSNVFTQAGAETFNSGGSTKTCLPARDYINTMFSTYFPGSTEINNTTHFSSDPTVGDTWVVFEDHDGNVTQQEKDAFTVLYRLASADGSLIGTMMGFDFATNRLDTTEDVSVSEDDTASLTIQPGLKNYRHISALYNAILGTDTPNPWASFGILFGNADGLNTAANKQLDINFYMLELQPAVYNGGTGEYDDDGGGFSSDTSADLSEDAPEGTYVMPVSADPGLVENDFVYFSDKYELYYVEDSDANRLALKTPLRRDISAQFSTGGNKGIIQFVNSTGRQSLATNALDCYAKAYGADGSRIIDIEFYDIDLLNPYETFTTDSSFPSSIANQTFRPSEITYDYINDRIRIRAYQIS